MRKKLLGPVLIVLALYLSSGCALFLVGAGGTGGYMIRKGEEGGSSGSAKKSPSGSQEKAPSPPTGDSQAPPSSSPAPTGD